MVSSVRSGMRCKRLTVFCYTSSITAAIYNVYTWICEKQMLLVGSQCCAAIDSFVILISFIITHLSECKVKDRARQTYSALCIHCVFNYLIPEGLYMYIHVYMCTVHSHMQALRCLHVVCVHVRVRHVSVNGCSRMGCVWERLPRITRH